uniref:Uncharacterized protein n=1 Tax=Setaria italica TaxID=4555 RepID=K3ZA84_SETIT
MHGRRLRDGQERRRRRLDGGHAPRARHEVHRPRRHGRSPRHLRPHHRRHHIHRDQPQGQALLPLRRLRAPLLRTRLRPRRARRRNGHRHRRRRGCQGKCTAAKVVCGHDPHPHLRGSSCSVRSHRRYHPLLSRWPISCRLERGSEKRTRLMHHCIQSVPFLGEHCAGSC